MRKSDIIRALDNLPEEILDKAYAIDFLEANRKLCTPRIQIDYDLDVEKDNIKRSNLAGKDDEDFAEYHINGWRVVMETNKG